jgi:transposase
LKPKSDITKEQERENIVLFLRQRMTTKGSLPFGTISEAAKHFGRHRTTIERIYMEIKPNSENERSITEQERQDIRLFLRQRMNAEGSLPTGTINDAAKHFGRHWNTISRIYTEYHPNSANERYIPNKERQDIMLFLRQRMNAEGALPIGTIAEAAKHFGRHWNSIERIYLKLKPKSVNAHIDEKTIVPTRR